MCRVDAGYARRGLRSTISAATKEGIVVQEVMHPPAGSLGSSAAGPSQPGSCAASAGAAADEDWSVLAVEMRDVGLHWAASKTARASEWCARHIVRCTSLGLARGSAASSTTQPRTTWATR